MTADIAAELTALADSIDQRLDNEHADRQTICEDLAARIRELRLQMLGSAPTRPASVGPFDTEQQARDLPAVHAIYDAARASNQRGVMDRETYLMLFRACEAAGVDLGGPSSYDRRILTWLANWSRRSVLWSPA